MQQLRVGVLGLGAFGESHLRAWRGLPNVEIVAVSSRTPARAEAIAAAYGVPRWYGSHEELIADPAVDAISVTTAEHDHLAPVVAALAAGKHVLVEKPIATTLEDAAAMVEAASVSDGILMPGHVLRFAPAYAGLREAVASGRLGRLVAMSARRNRPSSLIRSHGRVHPALITAFHDIDVMLWLAGCGARSVQALDRIADRDGGAHGLWGLLEFENGAVATIETSWLIPASAGVGNDDEFRVTGLEGGASVQFDVPALRVWDPKGPRVPDVSYEPVVRDVVVGALRDELAHFAACALAGTPSPVVTAADSARALSVVLALIESAESGRPVTPAPIDG
jgi:UDP-N-acetylglucosamine 3-dehydrogenase